MSDLTRMRQALALTRMIQALESAADQALRWGTMCRISPVSDDWVVKGCHVHAAGVELALRPDHLGGIVFRSVFSSAHEEPIKIAVGLLEQKLDDLSWRNKLKETTERAMSFLMGVRGQHYALARGRLFELRKLVLALERWESV